LRLSIMLAAVLLHAPVDHLNSLKFKFCRLYF
jgi:hypothetical protein